MKRNKYILMIAVLIFFIFSSISFATSLWNTPGDGLKDLFSDRVGRNVGDLVTIVVYESSITSNKAADNNSKSAKVTTSIKKVGNWDLSKFLPLSASSSYSKSNKNSNQSKVVANVTATIKEILPNGNYYVEGEKRIKVGYKMEEIRVKGIVRPEDISPNNTVESVKLADSQIYYDNEIVFAKTPEDENWFDKILAFLASIFFF